MVVMDSGLVASRRPGMTTVRLVGRRRRPRPLRAAQALERLGHAEHADVVEAAADDLDADGKTLNIEAAVDGDGGVLRHIPRYGIADVLEWPHRVVGGRGPFR